MLGRMTSSGERNFVSRKGGGGEKNIDKTLCPTTPNHVTWEMIENKIPYGEIGADKSKQVPRGKKKPNRLRRIVQIAEAE